MFHLYCACRAVFLDADFTAPWCVTSNSHMSGDTMPAEQTGWLAGLRDRYVGKVLTLMHQSPGQPWTMDTLANDVGLSRSALAQRFTDLIGQPPMLY
jgi:AraC-like DNA-binding protein